LILAGLTRRDCEGEIDLLFKCGERERRGGDYPGIAAKHSAFLVFGGCSRLPEDASTETRRLGVVPELDLRRWTSILKPP